MPQELLHGHNIDVVIQQVTRNGAPDVMRRQVCNLCLGRALDHNVAYCRRTQFEAIDPSPAIDGQKEPTRPVPPHDEPIIEGSDGPFGQIHLALRVALAMPHLAPRVVAPGQLGRACRLFTIRTWSFATESTMIRSRINTCMNSIAYYPWSPDKLC